MALSFETLAVAKNFAKSYTDSVISGIAGGIDYKGAVNYYSDLPVSPQQGDSYTVLYMGTSGNNPDGTQYVWAEYEGTLQWVPYGINRSLLKTYQTFRSTWTTNGTILQFCNDINADANASEGMGYVGELRCSDLPFNGNADTLVEIIDGIGTSNKVIHIIITSGNVAPYRWEYTYWNNGTNISGWIANTLVVIYTNSGNTITCNQTYQTIKSAIDNGQSITGWVIDGTNIMSIMRFSLNIGGGVIVEYGIDSGSVGTVVLKRFLHSSSLIGQSSVVITVLPSVNSSDNDKILGVVSGSWSKSPIKTINSQSLIGSGDITTSTITMVNWS